MWQYDMKTKTFVPGTLPADGSKISIQYARLSQEDDQDGNSESINNQLEFLLKYAVDNHLPNPRFFYDDGYTGTNFDRPGFKEAMEIVEAGQAVNFVVKDHSRLGRNRLVVGALTEKFTEDYGVRYIAVTDGIDSDKGFDEMLGIREWFNEFYPRDTSKKIRAVLTGKGNSGQRLCTQVPYGYTGNKYGWELDPEAAGVVRQIFALCMDGLGPMQIAKRLKAGKVLTPTSYKLEKGLSTPNKPREDPYGWDSRIVAKILERMEYTGCTVNFKTRKKSYKSKKTLYLPPEERRIFPDTHPAIIDRETWDRVQELRKNKRRPTKTGKRGLFSGLARCADCGSKLYFCAAYSLTENQEHYVCANYKSNTGSCAIHFIRETVLSGLVLEHLQKTISFVREHEDEFTRLVLDQSATDQRRDMVSKQKELAQAERRIAELDGLFQRVYEDNVAGKLNDERFSKLSASYEAEQRTLEARVGELRRDLEKGQEEAVNVAQFVALVKKYTEVPELTPTILNEFVKEVRVYSPDKSTGRKIQKIRVVYNFVGAVELPQAVALDNRKTA